MFTVRRKKFIYLFNYLLIYWNLANGAVKTKSYKGVKILVWSKFIVGLQILHLLDAVRQPCSQVVNPLKAALTPKNVDFFSSKTTVLSLSKNVMLKNRGYRAHSKIFLDLFPCQVRDRRPKRGRGGRDRRPSVTLGSMTISWQCRRLTVATPFERF